jgi:hypothetical protein
MSNAGKPSRIAKTKVPTKRRAHLLGDNGASNAGRIPDDIKWSDDEPITIFACSQGLEHIPQCDGTCPSNVIDESMCKLINEGLAWRRANMNFMGVPAAYENVIPVPGLKVELFDLELKFELLRGIVLELAGISEEEIDVRFREFKLERLREIRQANEAMVRQAHAAQTLGIQPKRILGPNGELL